ncbi:MAG TPA: mannose-1-phosphate guanylyltransferase [Rhodobiaceae bacterium]|nr:mannose-1-phosphate guanylyltransferase [Rhodobiaceae bacterium]
MIKNAMILAAGKGTRMQAQADDPPKPLTEIAGQSLLMRMVLRLEQAGIEKIIINLHHKADIIERAMAAYAGSCEIVFSDERAALLETGGGVKKALPFLGDAPFLVANGDVLWHEADNANQALAQMMQGFDPTAMDALLLLSARHQASGYNGKGDYMLHTDRRLTRRAEKAAAHIFAGVQILKPFLFDAMPEGAFSLNAVYDAAQARDALFGHMLDGHWMHVGTPDGRQAAQDYLAAP